MCVLMFLQTSLANVILSTKKKDSKSSIYLLILVRKKNEMCLVSIYTVSVQFVFIENIFSYENDDDDDPPT